MRFVKTHFQFLLLTYMTYYIHYNANLTFVKIITMISLSLALCVCKMLCVYIKLAIIYY